MADSLKYFSIDWLSEDDGPGKRVVLFLQGCHLDCLWCHSPHAQPTVSPLLFFENQCQSCGRCVDACKHDVHSLKNELHIINRERCIQCGDCVDVCPQSGSTINSKALDLPTRFATPENMFDMIEPQLDLLKELGGVTFSGGEALLQSKALIPLAKRCKEAGIHTCIETSGIVSERMIREISPFIDTWLFGMRLTIGTTSMSTAQLFQRTKISFDIIRDLENANMIVRIPAIDGYTNTSEYLGKVTQLIDNDARINIEVLPFNGAAGHYYQASGIDFNGLFLEECDHHLAYKQIQNHQFVNNQTQSTHLSSSILLS